MNSAIRDFAKLIVETSNFLAERKNDEQIPRLIAICQIYLEQLAIIFKEPSVRQNYNRIMNKLAREVETMCDPDPIRVGSLRDPGVHRLDSKCPDCGESQFQCPSGKTCKNGHGY
jgi:hypothetical protein